MWRRVLEVAGLYLGPGSLLSTVIICGNETGKRGKLWKGTTSECITLMGKWGSILDRGGSWGVYLQTFISYCLRVVPQHVWPPPAQSDHDPRPENTFRQRESQEASSLPRNVPVISVQGTHSGKAKEHRRGRHCLLQALPESLFTHFWGGKIPEQAHLRLQRRFLFAALSL